MKIVTYADFKITLHWLTVTDAV